MLRTSIRNQLMALLLFSIIVPVVASTAISIHFTQGELKERVVEENTRLLYQGMQNINNYMESFNRTTSIIYSTNFYQILTQGNTSYEHTSVIHASLQSLSHSTNGIYQIYLHIDADQEAYLLAGTSFTRGAAQTNAWAERIEPYAIMFEPPHISHNYGLRLPSYRVPQYVITYHRPIYQVPSTKQIGSLSIDITLDEIISLSDQLYDHGQEELFLIDQDGVVIHSSDTSLIGEAITEQWGQQILTASEKTGFLEWKDSAFSGSLIFSKVKTPSDMDWTLVKQIPDDYLYENVRKLTRVNILVAVALLIIAATVSLAMSLNITNPIKQLIRHINKIQVGQLNEPIKIERQDEIGIMAKRFQAMMDAINDLFLQRYRLELANKTNQLKMLQAQINPHFMNNALQSIGTLALQHQDTQVYKLISSLGQMMHYSMDTNETVLPLSEEFKYLDNYLQIQKQRFDENFQYQLTMEPQCNDILIPKMLLQPIVENYFKHGFISQKDGFLQVTAQLIENQIHIVIEDNGVGIDEQTMKKLQEELDRTRSGDETLSEGIGLTNVVSRLNLYYQNNQASLLLENVQPHGVRVTLTIPTNLEVPS